eukprot:TRINITY_DN8776_c0_g1_i1.p1 TRINITY_DN8776_c0_g1~~TRINITY_DN8776_c0_g1_i1.p1  ORF type:complete len:339 (+),score=58.33 TRINITY_DN8776_c0_g1_i1:574-1590(+)
MSTMPFDLHFVRRGPAGREATFQALKQKHGSTFAFHGSAAKNWASILHYGLKVLSDTDMEAHGKVHGHGVYLTKAVRLAATYSGIGFRKECEQTATQSSASEQRPRLDDLRVLCLCEVANVPEHLKNAKMPGTTVAAGSRGGVDIMVASLDGMVAPRLLLVYKASAILDTHLPRLNILQNLATTLLSRSEPPPALPVTLHAKFRDVRISSMKVMKPGDADADALTCGEYAPAAQGTTYFLVQACTGDSQATQAWHEGVWRRYNEFCHLRERVGDGPRAPFPRHRSLVTFLGLMKGDRLEDRRKDLERWLREVCSVARGGMLRRELAPELSAFLGCWAL